MRRWAPLQRRAACDEVDNGVVLKSDASVGAQKRGRLGPGRGRGGACQQQERGRSAMEQGGYWRRQCTGNRREGVQRDGVEQQLQSSRDFDLLLSSQLLWSRNRLQRPSLQLPSPAAAVACGCPPLLLPSPPAALTSCNSRGCSTSRADLHPHSPRPPNAPAALLGDLIVIVELLEVLVLAHRIDPLLLVKVDRHQDQRFQQEDNGPHGVAETLAGRHRLV